MNKIDIKRIKRKLGDIQILDYRGLDIVDAHEKLGEEVRVQVTRILENKIKSLGADDLNRELRFAQQIIEKLEEKSKSSDMPGLIQDAIRTYLECIRSWAHGAGTEVYISNMGWQHKVSPMQLAVMLQNDNSGCQTGALRNAGGGVLIWHTEEDGKHDYGKRFDKLRLAIFQCKLGDKSVDIYSLIYPDLLPGSAFNWRNDGYLQLVDALYLEQDETAGMLANCVCWLRLVLDTNISTQLILESLGPLADGYALSVVLRRNDLIVAEKYEFTRNQYVLATLSQEKNSYLFQVNLFSDDVPISLSQFEEISKKEKKGYLHRRKRTLKYLGTPSSLNSITDIRKLLTSRAGSPFCYASPWVKSYMFATLDDKEFRVWVGAGPASKNDDLYLFTYNLSEDKS